MKVTPDTLMFQMKRMPIQRLADSVVPDPVTKGVSSYVEVMTRRYETTATTASVTVTLANGQKVRMMYEVIS